MSFNLDELARRPDAPVLVVQYPQGIDPGDDLTAARALYGAFVVVPLEGSEPVRWVADALRNRDVVLWPWQTPGNLRDVDGLLGHIATAATRMRVIHPDAPVDMVGPSDLKRRLNGSGDAIAWAKLHVRDIPRPLVSDYAPHPDMIETALPPSDFEERADYQAEILSAAYTERGDEWPQPVDLFTKLPLPALRPEWLPPAIADFVFDQSEIIGTDPCIVALSCLVAAAVACHDSILIQPLRHNTGWTESARLWGAFVGDPSVKKTPALKAAIAHLQKININLAEQSAVELETYRRELKLHEKLENAHTRASAQGRSSGTLGPPPLRPPQRQIIANDATVEALGILMQDNPGGILLLHDELSSFFGSIDAYKQGQGKDGPFHLTAYNGGPLLVNRVGREPLRIRNASECILGGIQPDAMAKIAAKLPNDGMLQRFMVVIAQSVPGDGIDRAPLRPALEGWRSALDWIAQERPRADPAVTLSDGALRIRDALTGDLATLRTVYEASPRLTSHLGKWSALFVRLCLTYHALECAALARPIAGEVSADAARRVARFMIDYLFEHTRAFHEEILSDNWTDEYIKWIAGYLISRQSTEVTTRELYRAYRAFGHLDTRRQGVILQSLVHSSWLEPFERSNPGIPSSRWAVNPHVHTAFGHMQRSEADRRKSARELIKTEGPRRKAEKRANKDGT